VATTCFPIHRQHGNLAQRTCNCLTFAISTAGNAMRPSSPGERETHGCPPGLVGNQECAGHGEISRPAAHPLRLLEETARLHPLTAVLTRCRQRHTLLLGARFHHATMFRLQCLTLAQATGSTHLRLLRRTLFRRHQ